MNKKLHELAKSPIFFERNRVFRVYKGGALFNRLFNDPADDGNYPEEWIASSVRALNKISKGPKEGISKVLNTDIYLDDLITACKEEILGPSDDIGILVKALDSAVRLPVQVHPDKPFSRKHFNSEYGKAEAWIILDTRPGSCIYFGFKEGITKKDLVLAVEKSINEKTAMENLIVKHNVKKGEVYFIPARAVHAIGYGCLILEIQEPTDFTIQPEAWCDDYRLNDYEMYMGLDKVTALSCFDMSICGKDAIELSKVQPKITSKSDNIIIESLIDERKTDCFSVNRISLDADSVVLGQGPSIYFVTEGSGIVTCEKRTQLIKKGDYFLLPYCMREKCILSSKEHMSVIECFKGGNS